MIGPKCRRNWAVARRRTWYARLVRCENDCGCPSRDGDVEAADLKAVRPKTRAVPNATQQPRSQQSARAILAVNWIRLRQARGWSQEHLAHEAGLHRTFVTHVERQVRNISLDNIERLEGAFGVPTHSLLEPTPMACGPQ